MMKSITKGMAWGLVSGSWTESDLRTIARPGKLFWARRM